MKEIDYDKLAEKYKLTKLQRAFAEYFVFVTGLDGPAAVELAGYQCEKDFDGYDDKKKEIFTKRAISTKARDLLNNSKVTGYVNELRKNLDSHLVIDKLWVINNLKDLATNGSESARVRSLELLGKHLEMFTDKTKIEEGEDPSEIARRAYEKRRNTVGFTQRQGNE